ncbi:MAG TPA: ABC transporter substrate-binding protein [Pyrinomonadaceae bacterium]|nr:ABC transporter substrate-binding protein [Pyrinomonadaceae bacterium]
MMKARQPTALACLLTLCALVVPSFVGASAGQLTEPSTRQQPAQTPAPSPPPAASQATPRQTPLTEQERRGKLLYMRGESPAGPEVTAVLGEIDVPASTLSCAGCHGLRGEGKTEGGITAGALTWSHLTKSYGHTHPTGRKHGPFSESSFALSVMSGTDPAGNTLLVAMPRYRMSAAQMADLVAYLKRIEDDRDPGVTETAVTVGMIAPAKGPLAETGQAVSAATAAYFADLNRRGGLYNRRIELKVAETGETPAATAASLERLIDEGQVFALVNAFTAGADREAVAVASRRGVPVVGALTLLTETGTPPDRHVFFLTPGVGVQARALANFAARRLPAKDAATAVVHQRGSELAESAARAFAEQTRRAGRNAPAAVAYERDKFDAAATAAELKRAGAQAVLFAGAGDETKFLAEAEKLGYFPHVLLLGVLTGREVPAAGAGFKDKIFLSFPSVPSDITPEGMTLFRALARDHSLTDKHLAAQLSALAAAQTLAEGIKRAGRDLSREKLITALEGLYEFNTGLAPPLTFGPNRRVGAAGAHVVAVDVESRQYVPSIGWVSAEAVGGNP